jgi:ribosomal protein S8E
MFVISITYIHAGNGNKYGKEITLKEKTKISAILANPQKFVGKNVLVEGTVVAVCEKRGCWIELASDEKFQKIKIKVKDGEIVFPLEESGKTALVEGTVYEIKMTKEQAIESAKKEAEEHGTKFDPASVKGPSTIYQIKGLGAVIK